MQPDNEQDQEQVDLEKENESVMNSQTSPEFKVTWGAACVDPSKQASTMETLFPISPVINSAFSDTEAKIISTEEKFDFQGDRMLEQKDDAERKG